MQDRRHPLFVCPKWLAFTVAQRLSHVQSKNLCNNCLAVGHSTSSCRSTYRCRDCQQNHHTSIHQAATPPTPVNYSSGAPSQVPDALMMTAQVTLSGPGGQQLPARALIDPGAGISIVSSRVAQLLHLPPLYNSLVFRELHVRLPCILLSCFCSLYRLINLRSHSRLQW